MTILYRPFSAPYYVCPTACLHLRITCRFRQHVAFFAVYQHRRLPVAGWYVAVTLPAVLRLRALTLPACSTPATVSLYVTRVALRTPLYRTNTLTAYCLVRLLPLLPATVVRRAHARVLTGLPAGSCATALDAVGLYRTTGFWVCVLAGSFTTYLDMLLRYRSRRCLRSAAGAAAVLRVRRIAATPAFRQVSGYFAVAVPPDY